MTDIVNHTSNDASNKNVLAFPAGSSAAATTTAPTSTPTAAAATNTQRDDPFAPDGLPASYVFDEDGISELRENQDGDLVPTRICSPLVVMGRCRTADGRGWGRVLSVKDPDGTWHDLVLSAQQLNKSANAALAPLFDLGFELARVEKAAESVMNLRSGVHARCCRAGTARRVASRGSRPPATTRC
ncbi:MAG: DUF927 domain-containing protein [Loktanella sp.]|nr:DUF927 domain-containing protein [Loktanella sp.]